MITAAIALLLPLSLSARDWINTEGRTIQADLVEVKGESGEEVAVLKMANGKTYDVALDTLSEADREFALGQRETAASVEPEDPSIFAEILDNKLVAFGERRVSKFEMEQEPRIYAFYFTASWCPPCRAFTPKLVDFYNGHSGKKRDFEVVMVSRDNSEEDMEDYMEKAEMPWPAIRFRSLERMEEVQKYSGSGIPCLVLVDRNGEVLSHSYEGEDYVGPSKVMRDIDKHLEPQTASANSKQ